MARIEVDERLRRAAELRRTLREATRKLLAFGEQILTAREAKVVGRPESR
ncbi:MAG TPA: hypothetical protein VF403_23495 [Kofleriaceae bacterium]